jgi:hypothetical protein
MKPATYRDLAWDGLADILREAAETAGAGKDMAAALVQFRARFDAAIDDVPPVAQALDRVLDAPEAEPDGAIDPINRADEIAAHIGDAFKQK